MLVAVREQAELAVAVPLLVPEKSVKFFFFFQAEDGIRDWSVTGVQTCALPISRWLKGHETPLLLACRACQKGINIQNGVVHATRKELGGHGLKTSKDIMIELQRDRKSVV